MIYIISHHITDGTAHEGHFNFEQDDPSHIMIEVSSNNDVIAYLIKPYHLMVLF